MISPQDTPQNHAHLSHGVQDLSMLDECTILIVDENVSSYVLIARMLAPMGVYCEWKTSGYELVEFANSLPHLDLILMSTLLPFEDGFQALRNIRASALLRGIPIIATAVDATMELMDHARISGFDGFIGKPFNPDNFPEKICNILSGVSVWDLNKAHK